jgi:hypothetical protein
MTSSSLPPGVSVDPLVAHVPPGTRDADAQPRTVQDELRTPYTFDSWRADLAALAHGAPTGFDALDSVGMQWLPGRLYAAVARPGGGKTAFLGEAALRYLERHPDRTAAFLSWEEPVAELVLRALLRTDARRIWRQSHGRGFDAATPPIYAATVRAWGRGETVPGDFAERLKTAAVELEPLLSRLRFVDGDALGRDAHTVLAELATWMREDTAFGGRLGFVAVDYFQKLRASGFFSNRQSELQAVSDLLRRFAKGATLRGDVDVHDPRFALPVLVGAQVTRGGGEHPTGDQIREADDLLNDAAGVLAFSYESVGGPGGDEERALRLSVPKNRGGRARADSLAFYPWHPARHWFADNAQREPGVMGGVRWAPITPGEGSKLPSARGSNGASGNGTGRNSTMGTGVLD